LALEPASFPSDESACLQVVDPIESKAKDMAAAFGEFSPDGFRDGYTHLIELLQLVPDAINGCNPMEMDVVKLTLDVGTIKTNFAAIKNNFVNWLSFVLNERQTVIPLVKDLVDAFKQKDWLRLGTDAGNLLQDTLIN